MKKLFLLIITTCIASLGAWAQTSSVSATITDSTSQAYANGTYDILFRPAPGVPGNSTQNGSAFTKHFSGVLDASGAFAVTLTRNDFIQPGGSQWTFTICPLAASACFTSNQTIAAASVNLTAPLHTVTPIVSVFSLGNIPAAYSSSEIVVTPNPGSFFWNLTTGTFNFWNGASWTAMIVPTSNITFTGADIFTNSITGSGDNPLIWGGSLSAKRIEGCRSADQFGGFTNASINAAIQDLPSTGGCVQLAAGTWTLTGSGTELILVDRPVWFVGSGGRSTILAIDPSVPNTTVVIHVKPASNAIFVQDHWLFQNFGIRRAGDTGSTRASDAFLFDSSVSGVTGPANVEFDHVDIAQSTITGFGINTLAGASSNMWMWHIHDSQISNGIELTSATADSILIEHNAISGPNTAVEITSQSGAAQVIVEDNNITNAGGCLRVHFAEQLKFRNNQCEQVLTSTEPNSAMVDLDGDTAQIIKTDIEGNSLNTHNNATINIRVRNATGTHIYDNKLTLTATTGIGVQVTNVAVATLIGPNVYTGAGGGAVEVADSATAGANATAFYASTDTQHESYRILGTTAGGNALSVRGASGQGADVQSWQTFAGVQNAGIGSDGGGKFFSIKAGASGSVISDTRNLIQGAFSAGGTQQLSTHEVFGSQALTAGAATITFSGSAVFTSSATYQCTGANATALNNFNIVQTDGSHITINGTGTDTIRYRCIGN